ncbi:MAG: hypothetical protein HQ592_15140 [Planctomycetes bacterium]|nr:hypothetical protein [Planctomycetota bacterium]
MKGAQGHKALTGPLQWKVTTDEIDDVGTFQHSRYRSFRNEAGHLYAPLSPKSPAMPEVTCRAS